MSFSYSVSHDLRAPLRGIDGWSLALLEDHGPSLDSQAQSYLHRVRSECHRLGRLIDDLLQLSRTSRVSLQIGPLNLTTLVEQIADRCRDSAPDHPVAFTCDPHLHCDGDAILLEAAFENLLSNAWKFTGKTAQPKVVVGETIINQEPCFFVRDNGAGFDMRHAK
ncbi:MAG: hypothetical protein J6386_06955 [Candidatus Synoicihabitans palmerolidicus]|nr:hypothetical protein [Candidatus Synoicihabitans palmerolidicus]